MNTDTHRLPSCELTETVIGCGYRVSNTLGVGVSEKVYENALAIELRKQGLNVSQQAPIKIHYHGAVVGDYLADLIVEEPLLLGLKVVQEFSEVHMAQCMNYLKATGMRLCLLINFGKTRVDIKRIAN